MSKNKRLPKRSNPEYAMPLSFLDVLLNSLLILIVVFSLTPMSEKKQEEDKNKSPEELIDRFRIKATWDDERDDDVDMYVADPVGNLVFYRRREQGLMHLDRDDLGHSNDTVRNPDGTSKVMKHNEENITIRGIVPGEYTVNVHMYNQRADGPTEIRVRIFDLKGTDKSIQERRVTLEKNGQEKTAIRFTLDADGKMSNINSLPRKLAIGNYDTQGRWNPYGQEGQ